MGTRDMKKNESELDEVAGVEILAACTAASSISLRQMPSHLGPRPI